MPDFVVSLSWQLIKVLPSRIGERLVRDCDWTRFEEQNARRRVYRRLF